MTEPMEKKLHWTQRIALVQHNLHMAGLSRDFAFFKSLQAHILIEGIDYAAVLAQLLNQDDAATDNIVLNMDKFNAVIACVYEDAFKNIYGSVRACVADRHTGHSGRRAVLHADSVQQRQMADESIDKMLSLAIDMIEQQPAASQDAAANVLIRGATFTADAMEVCLMHMDAIVTYMDDPLRLENSWSVVQNAVGSAVSAMKAVFNLMSSNEKENGNCVDPQEQRQARSQSVDGYARVMLRRMSIALTGGPSSSSSGSTGPSRHSSTSSWASALSRTDSANTIFSSMFSPTKKPSHSGNTGNKLSPIPSTPAAATETLRNPFDAKFANDGAFSSNSHTANDASESDKHTLSDRRSSNSSDSIAPTDIAAAPRSQRQSPAFAIPPPVPPARTASDSAPTHCKDTSPDHHSASTSRRRSVNVMRGEAPSLERLLDEIVSIFPAPAAEY